MGRVAAFIQHLVRCHNFPKSAHPSPFADAYHSGHVVPMCMYPGTARQHYQSAKVCNLLCRFTPHLASNGDLLALPGASVGLRLLPVHRQALMGTRLLVKINGLRNSSTISLADQPRIPRQLCRHSLLGARGDVLCVAASFEPTAGARRWPGRVGRVCRSGRAPTATWRRPR